MSEKFQSNTTCDPLGTLEAYQIARAALEVKNIKKNLQEVKNIEDIDKSIRY